LLLNPPLATEVEPSLSEPLPGEEEEEEDIARCLSPCVFAFKGPTRADGSPRLSSNGLTVTFLDIEKQKHLNPFGNTTALFAVGASMWMQVDEVL